MQTKTKEKKQIRDLINTDTRFKRFREFLKVAGLEEKLSDKRTFTVFAPTNEAFNKLSQNKAASMLRPENREQLRKQLLLHVVPGDLDVKDLKMAQFLKTESGDKIKIVVSQNLKDIKLANANVVLPKEDGENGKLYPLDAVLQPSGTTVGATA